MSGGARAAPALLRALPPRRPGRRRDLRGLVAASALAAAALGCGGGWDVDALEARYGLGLRGHRLGDLHPYVLPRRGELVAFLCRWPAAARLRVAGPPDASPEERALWERALAAWQGALPDVGFVDVPPGRSADLVLSMSGAASGRAAQTVADCAVGDRAAGAASADAIPARLVSAAVHVQRAASDWRGHAVPLSEEELLGTMLHELGHALGFQGHARRGSVMVRDVEAVRRTGRDVLAGERFRDASLAALYRVPSGAVVLRRRVGADATAIVDRVAARAAALGFAGPRVRVGDRAGWIAWRHPDGRRVGVGVRHLPETLRGERPLSLAPDLAALAWLAGTAGGG